MNDTGMNHSVMVQGVTVQMSFLPSSNPSVPPLIKEIPKTVYVRQHTS